MKDFFNKNCKLTKRSSRNLCICMKLAYLVNLNGRIYANPCSVEVYHTKDTRAKTLWEECVQRMKEVSDKISKNYGISLIGLKLFVIAQTMSIRCEFATVLPNAVFAMYLLQICAPLRIHISEKILADIKLCLKIIGCSTDLIRRN